MTYLEEIEIAEKAYHKAIMVAKETWVTSPNNHEANEIYSRALDEAIETYDKALETARLRLK